MQPLEIDVKSVGVFILYKRLKKSVGCRLL